MRNGLLDDTVPNHRGLIRGSRWAAGTVQQHSLVFLMYLAASLLLFGAPILRDPLHTYLGIGLENVHAGYTDPSFYMWNFVWWPHAIAHMEPTRFTHSLGARWVQHGRRPDRSRGEPG